MRPARQVKVISSQLENLEGLKIPLEDLIIEIENILTQGRAWIDETDTVKSFTQMSHFLTSETFKCNQKCSDIANDDKDTSQFSSNTEVEKSGILSVFSLAKLNDNFKDEVKIKLNEIDQWMTKFSTELVNIKQKLKRVEKQNEIISSQWIEKDKKTNLQSEDFMKELHAASDFMSKLQSQIEMLTDLKNEHEKKLDNLILDVQFQKVNISDLTKNQQLNMEKLHSLKEDLQKQISCLTMNVQPLKKDIETVSSELVLFKTSNDQMLEVYKDNNNFFQKQLELQVSSKLDTFMEEITDLKIQYVSSKRVSFSVGLSKTESVLKGSIVKYDEIITNIGDGYSTDTGIFTCPLDGLYIFHITLLPGNNRRAVLGLYQNTDEIIAVYSPREEDAGLSSNMVTIYLKQDDEVFLKPLLYRKSHLQGRSCPSYNTFNGFLLSAD